jgi:molecular chaperone GrpE
MAGYLTNFMASCKRKAMEHSDKKNKFKVSENNSEKMHGDDQEEQNQASGLIDESSEFQSTDELTESADKQTGSDLLGKFGFSKKDKHKKEVEELKQQLAEANDKYIRLYAEFDNFRKRNARERIELFKEAGKDVVQSLLPVLDDFERALKQIEISKDTVAVKEGVKLIYQKLKNILEQKGLKSFDSVGENFDVEFHEAITEVPVEDENMKGKVIDEIEKGYKLNDKIIRFAKVVVGK